VVEVAHGGFETDGVQTSLCLFGLERLYPVFELANAELVDGVGLDDLPVLRDVLAFEELKVLEDGLDVGHEEIGGPTLVGRLRAANVCHVVGKAGAEADLAACRGRHGEAEGDRDEEPRSTLGSRNGQPGGAVVSGCLAKVIRSAVASSMNRSEGAEWVWTKTESEPRWCRGGVGVKTLS
jgi:hypothetical protein